MFVNFNLYFIVWNSPVVPNTHIYIMTSFMVSPQQQLKMTRKSKALRKTAFAEIFVFARFGNRVLPKIRVETSFSSFCRTCSDWRKLVPTLIFAKNHVFFAKNHKKIAKKRGFFAIFFFASFGSCFFRTFRKHRKNDVQLVSSRLVKTRSDSKLDSKFQIKFWNSGP